MVAIFVVILFLFFVSLDFVVLKFQNKPHPAFEKIFPEYLSLPNDISVPNDVLFSPGHTWIKQNKNGLVNIGLDEFVLKALGMIPIKNCSAINEEIKRGDVLFEGELGNKKINFISPIDGVVKSINTNFISKEKYDPYKNWGVQLQPKNFDNKQTKFFSGNEAFEWMKNEFTKLENFLINYQNKKELAGLTMYDGGTISQDAVSDLSDVQIELFEKEFLSF